MTTKQKETLLAFAAGVNVACVADHTMRQLESLGFVRCTEIKRNGYTVSMGWYMTAQGKKKVAEIKREYAEAKKRRALIEKHTGIKL